MTTLKITKDMIKSEIKGISLRFPSEMHKHIKSQASLLGLTKDEFFKRLVVEGAKNYDHEVYQE
jgi:hypothetical protein